MTRVRFDAEFIDDPRWERLGIDAFVLHVAACSYVARNLTDGAVSRARVRMLTPLVDDADTAAKALVDDELWTETAVGYHVCECVDDMRMTGRGDHQPSRAAVEEDHQRKRRWLAQKKERGSERDPECVTEQGLSSTVRSSPVPTGLDPDLHDATAAVDPPPAADCPHHPGQLAEHCGPCRSEDLQAGRVRPIGPRSTKAAAS